MINNTLNYLYATTPLCMLGFSGAVTTSSVHLNGPGGQSGDGFPVTRDGVLTALSVWDGSTYHNDTTEIELTAGDRLSVYCQNVGGSYTVKVRINGASSLLQVSGVLLNTTLFATLEFTQKRI